MVLFWSCTEDTCVISFVTDFRPTMVTYCRCYWNVMPRLCPVNGNWRVEYLLLYVIDTSQSLISPLCWEDFHSLIGCPISLEEGQSPETLVVMSDRQSAAVLQLSPGQVRSLCTCKCLALNKLVWRWPKQLNGWVAILMNLESRSSHLWFSGQVVDCYLLLNSMHVSTHT